MIQRFAILFFGLVSMNAFAKDLDLIRWTGAEDKDASYSHILAVLNEKTGKHYTENDFVLDEDRDLAFNHYQRYNQIVAGVPVEGKSIRVWKTLITNQTIQIEIVVDDQTRDAGRLVENQNARVWSNRLSEAKTRAIAMKAVKASDDPTFRGLTFADAWVDGKLVRVVNVKSRYGKHRILIGLKTQKLIRAEYREFPQADRPAKGDHADEFEIPALIFPMYEEVGDGSGVLPRVPAPLKYVQTKVLKSDGDIYAPMRDRRYLYSKMSSTLGETEEGRAQGYWSSRYLKEQAARIRASLPFEENTFKNGLLLTGRYATINIHPDAIVKYGPLSFTPRPSAPYFPTWIELADDYEVIPGSAFSGKPLQSLREAMERPATRSPTHDPKVYLNEGFDEIQVYYAINTLMESMQTNGMKDPELSTRPFNAYLFDPSIGSRDNAYYTDDTINFTTYSPGAQNYARDNSTIWHELGHGVMDRMMGDHITLADTGGLSEGMADFVAALVVEDVTKGKPFPGSDLFRIINKTGFHLTNEVHDDGEAYGGAMKDFLDATLAKDPEHGLEKVADVILEGMRLTRDHPGLTASEWFSHVLYADSLGRDGVRLPGELGSVLLSALAGRNFRLDGGKTASFKLIDVATEKEIDPGTPGSRGYSFVKEIRPDETANFSIDLKLEGSESYSFHYPIEVKIGFEGGPLQGAVHWVGQETPLLYTIHSDAETIRVPLAITGTCDYVNRDDGFCNDFVYVQIFNPGEKQPIAKKRYYVRVKNPTPAPVAAAH